MFFHLFILFLFFFEKIQIKLTSIAARLSVTFLVKKMLSRLLGEGEEEGEEGGEITSGWPFFDFPILPFFVFACVSFHFLNFFSSLHLGRSTVTRGTVGRDTCQSFRVCKVDLATLKVATNVSSRHSRRPTTTWTVSPVESLLKNPLLWMTSWNSGKMIRNLPGLL